MDHVYNISYCCHIHVSFVFNDKTIIEKKKAKLCSLLISYTYMYLFAYSSDWWHAVTI